MNIFQDEQAANKELLNTVMDKSLDLAPRRAAYIELYSKGMTHERIVTLTGVVFLDLFPERHTNFVHFPSCLPTKSNYGKAEPLMVGK